MPRSLHKIDDHHIFPRDFMKANYKDERSLSLIDCVANRTLIPKLTNISIGKNPPFKYLSTLKAKNSNIKDSLKSHFIPERSY